MTDPKKARTCIDCGFPTITWSTGMRRIIQHRPDHMATDYPKCALCGLRTEIGLSDYPTHVFDHPAVLP